MDELARHIFAIRTAHAVAAGLRICKTEPATSVCPCCQREQLDVARRRRNTAYVNEELIWLEPCGECFEIDTAAFQEQWDDYYNSR